MEQMLKQILTTLDSMQVDIKEIKTDVAELKTDVAELKTDMVELKATADRIEASQTEDVVAILKRIDHKTSEHHYENLALNKRVFRLEGEAERQSTRDQNIG